MSSQIWPVRYLTSYQKLVDEGVVEPFSAAERARWDTSERRESNYLPMLPYLELVE